MAGEEERGVVRVKVKVGPMRFEHRQTISCGCISLQSSVVCVTDAQIP